MMIFTLENALFGAAKLTKNADKDKYRYSGFGIRFDDHRTFPLSNSSGFGKNVIIFGVDMSSSAYVNNRKKNVLILWKVPVDVLDDTTPTAEKEYAINLTKHKNFT